MEPLRRAWRWLFSTVPTDRYLLVICLLDGSVLYPPERRTRRQAVRFMDNCVEAGLLDDTPRGFRWIPAHQIERIEATRINPNG
jgi:hypothetical protein